MKRYRILFLSLLLSTFVGSATAQNAAGAGSAVLPDVSGLYSFLHEGEYVQLTLNDAVLSGFISRYADDQQQTFVNQFFRKASWDGRTLSFETRPAKDVWYAFSGVVTIAQNKKPEEEGYRTLRGTLTTWWKDANGKEISKTEAVEFRSFVADSEMPD